MAFVRDQRPSNVSYYAGHREEEIARVTRRQRATLRLLRELRSSSLCRLRRSLPAVGDGLRSPRPDQKGIQRHERSGDAHVAVAPDGRGKEMRHRLRQLSRYSHISMAPHPRSPLVWHIPAPRGDASQMARAREVVGTTSRCPLHRLRSPLSFLRDAIRPSRLIEQELHGHPNDWPRGASKDPRGSSQVRYCLCELSSRADLPQAFG
jgi:hypothetical protein